MTGGRVARRYAAALFALVRERGAVDRFVAELERVLRELREQPLLRVMLEHPRVARERKEQLLQQAFGGLSREVRNLLRLLVRKRREPYLAAIHAELVRLRDEAEGVRRVEVRAAIPLPDDLRQQLHQRLERALGSRVRMQVEVQPELLGGLVVQIGERRLDASLRRRLQLLRERIAAGPAL